MTQTRWDQLLDLGRDQSREIRRDQSREIRQRLDSDRAQNRQVLDLDGARTEVLDLDGARTDGDASSRARRAQFLRVPIELQKS